MTHYADHDGTAVCGANDGTVVRGLVQTTCDACVEVVYRDVRAAADDFAAIEGMQYDEREATDGETGN